jgi:hypothetical protein
MDELGDDIDFDSYSFFFEAIRRFQKRNLTMEDDAIKAMSGIMQRVAECSGTEFLEALPVKIFPVALLFSHAAAEKFSFERGLPPRRRRTFPSWSWAGWANYPNWGVFDSGRFEESLRRCRITLYKFRPQEKPELVWQPGTEGSGDSSDLPSWPHDIRTNRPYPLLCFSAFAAVFAVSRVEHGFGLFDKQGKLSGYLYPDYQPRFLDDQLIEVITFGVYENAYTPLVSVEEGCRDEVWAMYIEWDGDVYERRGIGRLLPSSLEKSLEGLVWKNVILG